MCPVNTYCPWNSTNYTSCPAFSYSVRGQNSTQYCYCNPGYWGRADLGQACQVDYRLLVRLLFRLCLKPSDTARPQLCPAGSYCPSGNGDAVACSTSATSSPGSSSVTSCYCPTGMWGQAWLVSALLVV